MCAVHKFVALVVVVAATSLFFVVICPVTPTPIAVAGNHSPDWSPYRASSDRGFQLNTALVLVAAPLNGVPSVTAAAQTTDERPSQAPVIDLVCSRLC